MMMTTPSAACDKCGGKDDMLAKCVGCARWLCRCCISCVGQCAECGTNPDFISGVCSICEKREELKRCMMCRTAICDNCRVLGCLNRPITVFCKRCPPLGPLVMSCGRCKKTRAGDCEISYCRICCEPLCDNCLPVSFEGGVLKCEACCPAPVRVLNSMLTQTVVDATLISQISHTQQTTAQSKYRQLSSRWKLGEGGQGVVFKCTTLDGEVVVSKEMTFPDCDRPLFIARLQQAKKMQKLSHKHLIRYLEVIGSENPLKISVIMPYYSEGDLFKYIRRQRGPIEEHKLCSIILQVASAINYLHSQKPPLVHCDIKPENILLLNNEEQVLLMDFDLCRSCDAQPSACTRILREGHEASPTLEYRAPELAHSPGSPKSDVFSLGVVAFVLATLPEFAMLRNNKGVTTVLSDSDWTKDTLAQAVRSAIYRHTREYSEPLIDLIIKMLLHQPLERPQALEVMVLLTKTMEERLLRGAR